MEATDPTPVVPPVRDVPAEVRLAAELANVHNSFEVLKNAGYVVLAPDMQPVVGMVKDAEFEHSINGEVYVHPSYHLALGLLCSFFSNRNIDEGCETLAKFWEKMGDFERQFEDRCHWDDECMSDEDMVERIDRLEMLLEEQHKAHSVEVARGVWIPMTMCPRNVCASSQDLLEEFRSLASSR